MSHGSLPDKSGVPVVVSRCTQAQSEQPRGRRLRDELDNPAAPLVLSKTPERNAWLAGRSEEQGSSPLTRCCLPHLFTSSVFVGRAGAAFQEQLDDPRLLLACVLGTAPTSPGRLNCEVQGRRAGFVWRP